SRIFVDVKIVVRFAIRSPGVTPAERHFNGCAWMSSRITHWQVRGQREIIAGLRWIVALRADVHFQDRRRVDHKKRTGRISRGRRALGNGSVGWSRSKAEHG